MQQSLQTYKCLNLIIEGKQNTGSLYLGDLASAQNVKQIHRLGIKCVLTVAIGLPVSYKLNENIKHHVFEVRDQQSVKINLIWEDTFKIIEEALQEGNVLVHCRHGASRSASTVIAYLMRLEGLSLEDSFRFVKNKRGSVSPNPGFMTQLQEYSLVLQQQKTSFI